MCDVPCPMTRATPRRAFIAYKNGSEFTRNYEDTIDEENHAVFCEYTSASINPRAGCISVQRFHHCGRPQMLAYGSSRAVCLALPVNNDLRVFMTMAGHKDTVNCVVWVESFGGPTVAKFQSLLLSASADGAVKLWDVGEYSQVEICSFNVPQSVVSVHACYTDVSETELVLALATQDLVKVGRMKLTKSGDNTSEAELVGALFTIALPSYSCLVLRLACLTDGIVVVFSGLTSGSLEVRLIKPGEVAASLVGSLKGHSDWLNCLDIIKMYPGDKRGIVKGDHVLVATGSQDNNIRIWHFVMYKREDKISGTKGVELEAPQDYKLFARLESILSSHGNWVTGVSWSPVSWEPQSCPQLLSSSRDRTLIIWAPSRPLFDVAGVENEKAVADWLERGRYGNIAGDSLGYRGCAWGNYNNEVYGHGYWGELSTWSIDSEQRITLTGHYNAVTSLCWCNYSKSVTLNSADQRTYPPYLLTASRDCTVRLHGLFYTEGSGCNPPINMWRELARPQVHGYEMNDVVSLDLAHYVSAGDEKIARVFVATKAFVGRLLPDAVIEAHSSLQNLAEYASQPALGLSNQMGEAILDGEVEDANDLCDQRSNRDKSLSLSNPLYPPTETELCESTLWTETAKLYGHGKEVYALAVNPKRTLLASSCRANTHDLAQIILWKTENWQILQKLSFHHLTVCQMRFDGATGNRLLSVSRDRMWALWKADELGIFKLHHSSPPPGKGSHSRIIWACAWAPENNAFLTASRDKQIMAWDGETGERLCEPWVLPEPITAFAVGSRIPDSTGGAFFVAAAGFETGGVELLAFSLLNISTSAANRTCIRLFRMPPSWCHMGLAVRSLAFHPLDESWLALASGGDDGIFRIFTASPLALLNALTRH